MQQSIIKRSIGSRSRSAWVTLFLISRFGFGSTEILLSDLGLDPEDNLSEEELVIIEQLPFVSDREIWLPLLESLSFISEEDIVILSSHDKLSVQDLEKHRNLSEPCKLLLRRVGSKMKKNETMILIRQMMVKKDDTRYKWRIRGKNKSIQTGILIERDPGERNLMDFGSMFIAKTDGNSNWIIGDHQFKAGYGLHLWGGYPKQKGFEAINTTPRYGKGLKGYQSSHESWAFRGLGYSRNGDLGQWAVSFGNNYHDGYVDEGMIHFNHTGYHNTDVSISRTNQIRETTAVGMFHTNNSTSYVGAAGSFGYWQSGSVSQTVYAMSVFGEKKLETTDKIFGEICRTKKHFSAILGTSLKRKYIQYVGAVRSYPQGFTALRSNPTAEWSNLSNGEKGVFQGLRLKFQKMKITIFGDFYSENNEDARIGYENGIRIEWKKNRYSFRVQWKTEEKSIEDGGSWTGEDQPSSIKRETMKIWSKMEFGSQWSTRGQIIQVISNNENGYGLEIQTKYSRSPVSLWIQSVMADIDSYPSRIYVWALNLPGEMQSRMYTEPCISLAVKVIYHQTNWCFGLRSSFQLIHRDQTTSQNHAILFEVSL